VLDGAAAEGFTLRALGRLAIHLHAPSDLPEVVRRTYKDIDLVTTKPGDRGLGRSMEAAGYTQPAVQHAQRRAHAALLRRPARASGGRLCRGVQDVPLGAVADRLDVHPLIVHRTTRISATSWRWYELPEVGPGHIARRDDDDEAGPEGPCRPSAV
jgi:hypothetical protein